MEEPIALRGVSHVSLSVSDLQRSLEFYRDILRLPLLVPPQRGLKFEGDDAMLLIGRSALSLHAHDDGDRRQFDPQRVGLDHLAFHVSGREELEKWVTSLDASSYPHSGIMDVEGFGYMIELRDPDGIQLELFATKP